MRKQYDFKIKGAKVFAACNEIARLSHLRTSGEGLYPPVSSDHPNIQVHLHGLYQ
jgi:hypothetical protein